MFADRASRMRATFALTARNEKAIGALCERLEGIPLAIEMAAARISILTPDQILSRLDQRFELLVNQSKDVPKRHRTLEATLDWSYKLLTSEQQKFLCTLSVFRGGWTLEAAEAVSEDSQALEHMQALMDASLVQSIEQELSDGTSGMRYSLLETVRQFAEGRLRQEDQVALWKRHGEWLCGFTKEMRTRLTLRLWPVL